MKKIVALVLALALALSLCTVAMAYADDTYKLYPATSEYLKDGAVKAAKATTTDAMALTEVAAKTNSDGSGVVAYLAFDNEAYVKTTTPTVNDWAVTEAGKTAVLYYVTKLTNGVRYDAAAKEFTNFGTTTGQVYDPEAGATYYVDGDGIVYIGANNGTEYLLVNGEIVRANAVEESETLVSHKLVKAHYVVTATKASSSASKLVPTEVTDTNSNTKYTAIYKATKAPAGSTVVAIADPNQIYDGAYVFVKTAATTATTTTTVDSSKTFDAGVAMYVGLSLMSVAGSAVVIGKKKEF